MTSSPIHVHYGAVWPALLLRARQKVSLGSLEGPPSSAEETHGGEINHLTEGRAAAAKCATTVVSLSAAARCQEAG